MELQVDGRKVYAATGGRPFDPAKPRGHLHPRRRTGPHQLAAARALVCLARPCRARRSTCRATAARTGRRWRPIPDMAQWIGRLMDAANVKRAGLVGHSMGGAHRRRGRSRTCPIASRASPCSALPLAMPVNDALLTAARDAPEQAHQMITGLGAWATRQDRRQPGARPLDVRRLDGAARAQPAGHAPRRLRCLQPLEVRTRRRPARALPSAGGARRQRLR